MRRVGQLVRLQGHLRGQQLDQVKQIPEVACQGGVSYKFFTGYAGAQAEGFDMSKEGISPAFFYEACRAINAAGRPVFPMIHAEDPFVRGILIDELRRMGRSDHLTASAESRPEWAESVQIYTYGHIANQLGCLLYPVHISAAQSVDTIARSKPRACHCGRNDHLFYRPPRPRWTRLMPAARAKSSLPVRFQKDRDRSVARDQGRHAFSNRNRQSHLYRELQGARRFLGLPVGVNNQVADTFALIFDEAVNRRGMISSRSLARCRKMPPDVRHLSQKRRHRGGLRRRSVVVDPEAEVTLGRSLPRA